MNTAIVFAAQYLYLIAIIIAALAAILADAQTKRRLVKLSILALPLSFIISRVAHYLIYNPRPFAVEHIQPLIPHAADNGFPSDHTLLIMTVAAITFSYNRKVGVGLAVLGLAIGYARVIAKIHHPLDIWGSVIISWSAVYISYIILKRTKIIP